jgi:hypothetical protein
LSEFRRLVLLLAVGIAALNGDVQAFAQVYAQFQRPPQARPAPVQHRGENFSAGKTPQQLFASDCSGCHRAPQGLARNRSAGTLGEFMREHYTNSRESAYSLANYLNSVRSAAPPPRPAPTTPAGGAATASVPRPPGSIPGDGDSPAAEQPPRQGPSAAASKRNGRGAPVQAAARQTLPSEPPEPKPDLPEIFD